PFKAVRRWSTGRKERQAVQRIEAQEFALDDLNVMMQQAKAKQLPVHDAKVGAGLAAGAVAVGAQGAGEDGHVGQNASDVAVSDGASDAPQEVSPVADTVREERHPEDASVVSLPDHLRRENDKRRLPDAAE
ncbi:MAG: hypothetical protein AAFO61_13740, partial [Pseudomonadota bacterium]